MDKISYPICISGEIGYYEKSKNLSNPQHKEYDNIKCYLVKTWTQNWF